MPIAQIVVSVLKMMGFLHGLKSVKPGVMLALKDGE